MDVQVVHAAMQDAVNRLSTLLNRGHPDALKYLEALEWKEQPVELKRILIKASDRIHNYAEAVDLILGIMGMLHYNLGFDMSKAYKLTSTTFNTTLKQMTNPVAFERVNFVFTAFMKGHSYSGEAQDEALASIIQETMYERIRTWWHK